MTAPLRVAPFVLLLACLIAWGCGSDAPAENEDPFGAIFDLFDTENDAGRSARDVTAGDVLDAGTPDVSDSGAADAVTADLGNADTTDAEPADATDEHDAPDAAAEDASNDGGADAELDAEEDAGPDAIDAGDTGPDAIDAGDTGPDAIDAGDTDPDAIDAGDTGPDDAGADTGPALAPSDDLSVLVVAPSSTDPATLAAALQESVSAHPDWTVTRAEGVAYDDASLFGFMYRWTGREARLAPLLEGWDIVVLVDGASWSRDIPELHFEGVRAAAALARSAGSVPVLGFSSERSDLSYRVANGVTLPAVPAVDVAERAASASWWAAFAASFARELTGEDARSAPPASLDIGGEEWSRLIAAAEEIEALHARDARYEGAFFGVVRVHERELPETYRFLISGTSSERGYRSAMGPFLVAQGLTQASVDVGSCNPYKSVDEACLGRAATHFEANDYVSMYARYYDVDAARIAEVSAQPALRPQVYDRHWDDTANDAVNALDQIESRGTWVYSRALAFGLDWIPMHLTYAKLKVEFPSANLLSDGVHATSTVQTALAAMTYVSATGRAPVTTGYDELTARAIQLGEETIRQLAHLSESGTFVADAPSARPTLRGVAWDRR